MIRSLPLTRRRWTAQAPPTYASAMLSLARLARDIAAVLVTVLFGLPILWWVVSSITPNDALLDLPKFLRLDFSPTPDNFAVAILGEAGSVFDSRESLIDSTIVALLSTVSCIASALPAAFALSRVKFRQRENLLRLFLLQRFVPTIALIFPLVVAYHMAGLIDSRFGLALAHAGLNLPVAILLLKSFMDDVPSDIGDAATIDGATLFQNFSRIMLPSIKGGIAAAAILCFILSWTEFMLSLFLTQNMRLVPVQAQVLTMNMWGLVSALTTAALLPVFALVMMMQKHLVRGLTMGLQK
jgi:multiple sugar transport system permease protein